MSHDDMGILRKKYARGSFIQGHGSCCAKFSPINNAWLILWGSREPIVLAVKQTRAETIEYMREIGALP